MSLERDIARAARELREERRIERQEWRKIHRFVRQREKRRPLMHNGGKARKELTSKLQITYQPANLGGNHDRSRNRRRQAHSPSG